MRREPITLVQRKETKLSVLVTDAYMFNHKPGWKGKLQAIAWDWLRSSGALREYYEDDIAYTKVHFYEEDFLKYITKAHTEFFYQYNKRPTTVYIGSEDFQEFLAQPFDVHVRIGFTVNMSEGEYGRYTTFGVPVVILPHMKGLLFV